MDEMTPWERYKRNIGDVRPWDFLSPNTEFAEKQTAEDRYDICLSCPQLVNITKQCKLCGCFMLAKTKLENATCPLGKW
jgi:hypothetical protein